MEKKYMDRYSDIERDWSNYLQWNIDLHCMRLKNRTKLLILLMSTECDYNHKCIGYFSFVMTYKCPANLTVSSYLSPILVILPPWTSRSGAFPHTCSHVHSHAGDVMEQCGVGHCTLGYFIHRACQFYVVNCWINNNWYYRSIVSE